MIQAAARCIRLPEESCGKENDGREAVTGDWVAYEGAGEGVTEGYDKHPLMTAESEELEKKEYNARRSGGGAKHVMTAMEALDTMSRHLTVNKAQLFPTCRRPEKRELSLTAQEECDEWVRKSGMTIYEGLSQEERDAATRLVYTWRNVFVGDLPKIKTTDLLEHGIDLIPGAVPERSKTPLYSEPNCGLLIS